MPLIFSRVSLLSSLAIGENVKNRQKQCYIPTKLRTGGVQLEL
jgi:hypothetical protein